MDFSDVKNAATYFKNNVLDNFYVVVTYNGNGFILVGEADNFPHLMGINHSTYVSNGYAKPRRLFTDILDGVRVSNRIIPNSIARNSKMYNKVKDFNSCIETLLDNKFPVIIKYDKSKTTNSKLDNVDLLISDLNKGFMLGWIHNSRIPINGNIGINKYCISTWIDEFGKRQERKEKYTPNQDIELIKAVLVFDKDSELIKTREYKYNGRLKKEVLDMCYRNNSNLLVSKANADIWIKTAKDNNILAQINGEIYNV